MKKLILAIIFLPITLFPQTNVDMVTKQLIILTTFKKAYKSDGWIIQWYESKGKDVEAVITLPGIPERVFETNFIESEGEEIPFENNKVKIRTPKNSVKTIKVIY